MPAAMVTTTVAVSYTANIGVTRRPRWSHRSKATTKIHQATPSFPRPAGWGRVPTGPSSGAPCPYPRRESRVVQPNELLLKGSGIKAVFSLALLPRRPYIRESPCSVGGGVDSSNHQFPRQTDCGQEHRRPPPDCKCVCESVGPHWDRQWRTAGSVVRQLGFPPGAIRISTSQSLRHTVSRALKQKNLYLGTGLGWTLCMCMYTATRGACIF